MTTAPSTQPPETEPTAGDLADLTEVVRDNNVRTVYYETLVSPDVAETVAQATGYFAYVPASLPPKTVKELIDYAKARPGELNYVSVDDGSPSHLSTAIVHGRVLDGNLFDVLWINRHAAGIEHVFLAIKNAHEPLLIHGPQITRVPEAGRELLGGGLRPVPVARHHLRPAHAQLARLAQHRPPFAAGGKSASPAAAQAAGVFGAGSEGEHQLRQVRAQIAVACKVTRE